MTEAELVESIRECEECDPSLAVVCGRHRAVLDALLPTRCSDPDCYACREDE